MIATAPKTAPKTAFTVLAAISFCHFLNDVVQSLVPAIYPLLKNSFQLDFSQIGLITLTFQLTASLLQPLVGYYTDRRAMPYSLVAGMSCTLVGLITLSLAPTYMTLLAAAALVGMGSAVFHPESSRVARLASGGQHGLAQSLFQVGGNAGSAAGPLLAAFIVLPHGQRSVAWFSVAALLAIIILTNVGHWSKQNRPAVKARTETGQRAFPLARGKVAAAIGVLVVLIFSKYFYLVSLTNYYTFYLMHKFALTAQTAQIFLFLFLGSIAAGTVIGGPVGDRMGRKFVIWWSIFGIFPFTMALPYASLFWTAVLTVVIGIVMASAFSAILVYAQELMPGRVGMVSGLFFGFAFGMAGVGAAVLGELADRTSIDTVYRVCSFLPLIGLLTWFLPDLDRARRIRR